MKTFYAMVGLAAMIGTGSANASLLPGTAIYSSFVTNTPDQAANPNFKLLTGAIGLAGSPLAQEFAVAAPGSLGSLDLRLSDATPTDGGSILVYLVPNAGNVPTFTTGNQLTGTTLLTTILDSALPVNGANGCIFGGTTPTIDDCNTLASVNAYISTPGNYWIALVNGSDTINGGSNPNSSGAVWWRSGDNPGGLNNAHVSGQGANNGVLVAQNLVAASNSFELQVNTPEPASLALLGAGIAGLGFVRRRQIKTFAG